MHYSNAVGGVPDFWTRMVFAEKCFLGLDYDGTLAPFKENRNEAYPLPGIVDAIRDISRSKRTFLSIFSGRPVVELVTLLGNLQIPLVGSHGFELTIPGGYIWVKELSTTQVEGLEAAKLAALGLELECRLETKVASLALHTRDLCPDDARVTSRVSALWAEIGSAHELQCRRFNGGIELRAEGWDKGNAFRSFLDARGADFCVYIGDDQTDEDVFRTLLCFNGIGIKVGQSGPPTLAVGYLQDCLAVREFLKTWRTLDTKMKD